MPPPFEKLVGDHAGACSRRINVRRRLIYQDLMQERTVKELRVHARDEQPPARIRRAMRIRLGKIALAAAVLAFAVPLAAAPPAPTPAAPITAPRALKPYQADAREMLRRAVAFKTQAGAGQVPALAEYLASRFREAGFAAEDVKIVPLGETASLVVRYRGAPPAGAAKKPIALLGHMDVVTAKPEDWKRDPFTLVEENGYFFGRGVSDDKGSVVAITSALLRLKAEGFVPTRDLVAVFTGDEETGMLTVQDLLKRHRDLVDAEFALNGDAGGGTLSEEDGRPLVYGLQTAEKTYVTFEVTATNPGGHSSRPRKDNAIYDLADALEKVRAYRFAVMWNDTTLAWFRTAGATTPGPRGEAMRRFGANPRDVAAADALFDSPPDVGATRTTCVATMLRGGHAENALPQSATATVNCRIFPGVKPDEVKAELQKVVGSAVTVTTVGTPQWSDASPLRPDVLAAVTKTVQSMHPGVPVSPIQESGGTDGLWFRAAGIPCYGVGEIFMKESDVFAHGLNERVPVAAFYDGLEHWYRLLKEIAGPKK
jgi:acetylornithine deacetylase/succinyl-diaminopimelate desuccinylase-like protein